MLRIFTSRKIHGPQSGLSPQTLVIEASTLSRDHRGRRQHGLETEKGFDIHNLQIIDLTLIGLWNFLLEMRPLLMFECPQN